MRLTLALLLLSTPVWAQALPPVAGPPQGPERAVPAPTEPYRPLPPPRPFPERSYGRPAAFPPAMSAQELQAGAEARDLRWRIAIEAEFGDWWSRYQCLPHPDRQGEWLEALGERLEARSDQQRHVLLGLVMERVELYGVTAQQFSGLLGGAENWVNGVMGWRAPGDLFCPP